MSDQKWHRPRAAFRAAIAVLILACSARAEAQPSDADPHAEADRLFREGRIAAKSGNPRLACARFEASLRLERTIGTLINLGDCEEKLGHWVSALSRLRQASAELPPGDDRDAPVRERIGHLATHLPELTVLNRSPLLAGARVFRDDVEIGSAALGVAIGVDPGAHRIRVVVPGAPDRVFDIAIAEDEHRQIWIEDIHGPQVAISPPSPLSMEAPRSPLRTVGWISIGVGGAALVTSAVTGLLTIRAKDTVAGECDPNHACSQRGLDALDSGPTYSTISSISFVAAVTTGAIGAYLLLTHPTTTNKSIARGMVVRPTWSGLEGSFE